MRSSVVVEVLVVDWEWDSSAVGCDRRGLRERSILGSIPIPDSFTCSSTNSSLLSSIGMRDESNQRAERLRPVEGRREAEVDDLLFC